jgi:hypothetical protein
VSRRPTTFVAACLLTGVGASLVFAPTVAALVVPTAFCLLALVLLVRLLGPGEAGSGAVDRRLLHWTLGAFALHLGLGLVINSSHTAVTYLGADALTYHQRGSQLALAWMGKGPMPHFPAGKEGFFYELGGLYYLFGPHAAAGLAFNAAAAAALVPLLTDITRRLFGPGPARYAAPLVVLLPGFLLWTSMLLREATVLFLLAAAIDFALTLSDHVRLPQLAGLAATLGLLFAFRANVAYVAAGGIVIGLVLSRRRVLSGVGVGAAVLSISLLLVASAGLGYSGYRLAAGADLKQVNAIRVDSASSASSGFAASTDISTPSHALGYLPQGLVTFGLGPFPWDVGGVRQLPALLDAAVLWALLPSLWRGFVGRRRRKMRAAYMLLIPAAILMAMLSLLVANFGTVVRERMQVIVFLVPLIALGLAGRKEARSVGKKAEAAKPDLPEVWLSASV